MNKDLKDPANMRLFPYVVNAYNIYVLIKEMASHWPSMKENVGQTLVEKGNKCLTPSYKRYKSTRINCSSGLHITQIE